MTTNTNLASLYHMIVSDTPLGNIFCSASSVGLVSLAFYAAEDEFADELNLSDGLRKLREEIDAYFKGSKQGFTTRVDLSGLSEFQRDVLTVCLEIPFGAVKTYGELANAIGKPGAAQAVGGVMARNPIPLVIPCHRVVAAGGGLHGYSAAGGLKTKQFLLALEGVTLFDK